MKSLRLAGVALLLIGVIAMSLYPTAPGEGSYQQVEGPTTVFQALRAVLLLLLMIVAAATSFVAFRTMEIDAEHVADPADLTCSMLC